MEGWYGLIQSSGSNTDAEPSDEELVFLELLVTGMTDVDVAMRLGWHERTVRRRLRQVMDKLGARSRIQLGYRVAQSGWLEEKRSREGSSGAGADSGQSRMQGSSNSARKNR